MKTSWISALLVLTALPAFAGVRLPIQGNLVDTGTPVVGPVTIEFTLTDGGTGIACERFTGLALDGGRFSIILGDTANDCGGGLPSELDESFFLTQGLTLVAAFGGDSFTFPVGEAPRAGFAVEAGNALSLGGRSADEIAPQAGIFQASAGADTLSAAVVAATASGFSAPTVVLGPGAFTLSADLTLPDGVRLRGQGAQATRIFGNLLVTGSTEIQGLAIEGDSDTGIITVAATGALVELRDLLIRSTDDDVTGLGTIAPTNATTRIELIDSRVEIDATIASAAVLVTGANALVSGVSIDVRGPITDAAFGIIFDGVGERLDVRNSRVNIDSTGAGVAFALFSNAVGGVATVSGTELRSSGRAVRVDNGDVRIDSSQLIGDEGASRNAAAALVIAHSSIEATTIVATGSQPLTCRFVYDADTLLTLQDDCL